MKRLAWTVIIVAAIIAGVILLRRPVPAAPFADTFPRGAIAYAGVVRPREFAEDVLNSNSWKLLSGTETVGRMAGDMSAGLGKSALPFGGFRALAAALGEESAVALYGDRGSSGTSLLIATRGRGAERRLGSVIIEGLKARPAGKHKGMDLYSFGMPGAARLDGALARGGDVDIAALSGRRAMELLKSALDTGAGKGNGSLAVEGRFVTALGRPPRTRGKLLCVAYLDMQAARAGISGVPFVEEAIRRAQAWLSGVRFQHTALISWGAYVYRDRGLTGKVRMLVDPSRMAPEEQAILACKPGRLESLEFAPEAALAAAASRVSDGGAAVARLREKAIRNPALATLAALENRLGIGLVRDVIPWIGDEVCVHVSDISTEGLFPMPRAGAIVKTKDRSSAEKALTKAMGRAAVPSAQGRPQAWDLIAPRVLSEKYEGRNITTLSYPIPGFAPSFAAMGDYLILGLDPGSVREAVDTGEGRRPSILAAGKFSDMRGILPSTLNQLTYVDCDRAIEAGQGLLNWVLSAMRLMTASSDPERAARLERAQADLPGIIAGLKALRAAMFAERSGDGSVDDYFVIRMRDVGQN